MKYDHKYMYLIKQIINNYLLQDCISSSKEIMRDVTKHIRCKELSKSYDSTEEFTSQNDEYDEDLDKQENKSNADEGHKISEDNNVDQDYFQL